MILETLVDWPKLDFKLNFKEFEFFRSIKSIWHFQEENGSINKSG